MKSREVFFASAVMYFLGTGSNNLGYVLIGSVLVPLGLIFLLYGIVLFSKEKKTEKGN